MLKDVLKMASKYVGFFLISWTLVSLFLGMGLQVFVALLLGETLSPKFIHVTSFWFGISNLMAFFATVGYALIGLGDERE